MSKEEPKVVDNVTFTIDEEEVEISMEDLRLISRGVRPDKMDYELFKKLRRQIRREEKIRSRGVLTHMSKMSDEAWKELNKDYYNKHGFYPKQIGHTYVKEADE